MSEAKQHPLDAAIAVLGVKPVAEMLAAAFDRATSGPRGEARLVAWLERLADDKKGSAKPR